MPGFADRVTFVALCKWKPQHSFIYAHAISTFVKMAGQAFKNFGYNFLYSPRSIGEYTVWLQNFVA